MIFVISRAVGTQTIFVDRSQQYRRRRTDCAKAIIVYTIIRYPQRQGEYPAGDLSEKTGSRCKKVFYGAIIQRLLVDQSAECLQRRPAMMLPDGVIKISCEIGIAADSLIRALFSRPPSFLPKPN